MSEWRMVGMTSAIFLLTVSVLVIRYGHIRYLYEDNPDGDIAAPPRGSHN